MLVGQRHSANFWRKALGDLECSPVKGLQRDPRFQPGGVNLREQARRKGFRRSREFRLRRVNLGFDVESHGAIPRLGHQGKQIGEPRDTLAVDRLLLREPRRVVAARPQASDVVVLELRVAEAEDGRSRRLQKPPRCIAGMIGVQQRIVANHDHTIPGHGAVQFKGAHTQPQSVFEPG